MTHERLDYEATLSAILAYVGQPVYVGLAAADQTLPSAVLHGILDSGQTTAARRLDDDDAPQGPPADMDEAVVFTVGTQGQPDTYGIFFLFQRVFEYGELDEEPEGVSFYTTTGVVITVTRELPT